MSFSYTLFKAKLLPVLPFLIAEAIAIRRRQPKLPSIVGNLTLGQNPNKILVLGESTVAGVGASQSQTTIGGQLFQLFGEKFSIRNIGKNGLLARNAIHLLENRHQESHKDFTGGFIFLGANDCFKLTHPQAYRIQLETLIDHIQQVLGSEWIYLADIPPVHLFPAFSSLMKKQLQIQRGYLQKEMIGIAERDSKVIYDPIYLELSQEFFAADGIHPSDLGYQKIAEFAGEGLRKRGFIL
jgi:lysophospholipase L1-like esterase